MSIVEEPGQVVDPRVIRWTGYGVAVVGTAAGATGRFFPNPALTLIAIVAPLVTLAIVLYAPQLFIITTRTRRGINMLLLGPVVGLGILAFQHTLIDFVWPLGWTALGAVVGLALCLYSGRAHQVTAMISLSIFGFFFGGAYVISVLMIADIQFDRSPGQPFTVEMIGKHESHGRSTSYYLDLPPRGPRTESNSVGVDWSTYQAAQNGDPVCIVLHPGTLGGRWFTAQLCPAAPPPLPAVPPAPTEPSAS